MLASALQSVLHTCKVFYIYYVMVKPLPDIVNCCKVLVSPHGIPKWSYFFIIPLLSRILHPLGRIDFISMGIDSLFVSESNLLIFSSIVQFFFPKFYNIVQ